MRVTLPSIADLLPEELDRLIAGREALYPDLTPGAAAGIVWATMPRRKTVYSIVYIHGFSATRMETYPLCDYIAAGLGANLYYPRLTGHGRSGDALAQATADDWINDAREALDIGRYLGEKVIVIGMSTGGAIATWMAVQPGGAGVSAWVLISPNFGLRNRLLHLLRMPIVKQVLPLARGNIAGFTPFNSDHEKYWTSRYPVKTLPQLLHIVNLAWNNDWSIISRPVMVVYSPNDRLLDVRRIGRFYRELRTAEKRLLPIMECGNDECHIIAGDILSPATTLPIADAITEFIKNSAGKIDHRESVVSTALS